MAVRSNNKQQGDHAYISTETWVENPPWMWMQIFTCKYKKYLLK